jgi:predicted N-acetyltransferase YhbS
MKMVKITYELRGKRISLERMDSLERQALEAAGHKVAHALASVRCKVHGYTPEVLVLGEDVHHLEFRVRGCCTALMNEAMDQLREQESQQWWQQDPIPKEPWVKD